MQQMLQQYAKRDAAISAADRWPTRGSLGTISFAIMNLNERRSGEKYSNREKRVRLRLSRGIESGNRFASARLPEKPGAHPAAHSICRQCCPSPHAARPVCRYELRV